VWTTLWSKQWTTTKLNKLKCKYSNCIITSDKTQLNTSDALLFHLRDINIDEVPKYHIPHQKWVLFNMEPPIYSPIEHVYPIMSDTNWVMSYRQDSDIYMPYGSVKKCEKKKKVDKNVFRYKKKNVVWVVSNCNTTSKRESYVNELQKYIDVDVYGKCGSMKCVPKFGQKCYNRLARDYRFYLAFENSVSFLFRYM
jgi:alpha-1,3-fucosyltransferase